VKIFLSILLPLLFLNCLSGDFHPKYLRGTKVYIKEEKADFKQSNEPIYFMEKIDNLRENRKLEFRRIHEITFFQFFFGAYLKKYNTGDLSNKYEDEINSLKPEADEVLVIHNISITDKVHNGMMGEFLGEIYGSILVWINSYYLEAEMGIAKKSAVQAYLEGKGMESSPKIEEKRQIVFTGKVFNVSGNKVTVATTSAKSVHTGAEIVFLDGAGKEIGTGKVIRASFTNIEVNLVSGRAEKDRPAVIFKRK